MKTLVSPLLFALVLAAFSLPAQTPSAPKAPRPILESSVFDWEKLAVRTTRVGQSRPVFNHSTPIMDRVECHVTTLNPGETPHPPHRHAHEEVIIIKEGLIEVTINGQSQRVGPGSILFYASNDLHTVRNVGSTPATYHVVTWAPRAVAASPAP